MSKVLVVDDKQMMRDSVCATLVRAGFTAVSAVDGYTALEMIRRHRPAAVVTDLKMPNMDGLELLDQIMKIDPHLPVVLMTAYASIDTAVQAMKDGAFDYVQKPFDGDELIVSVRRAVEHGRLTRENELLKQAMPGPAPSRLVGQSPAMAELREQIARIADSHGTVLISGESGVGKEVVAREIHARSPRTEAAMLCVNCAALSPSLLESELFGHEKGAFTGAEQMRKGRFELADGGTLLLDEISEVEPAMQAKLLRVLQERQLERVGSSVTLDVDVRVIATTNRDLNQAVDERRFREDLYFRLNVLPIRVPALRERVEDVPALAEHFLNEQLQREGRATRQFDPQALALMTDYHWPGNVRELRNICERAAVLSGDSLIEASLIEPWLAGAKRVSREPTIEITDRCTLEDFERQVIVRTLNRYNGHRQQTASALGIGVRTLGLKLRKWKDANLVAQTL